MGWVGKRKGRDLKKGRERVVLCEMTKYRGAGGVWVEVEKEWEPWGMGSLLNFSSFAPSNKLALGHVAPHASTTS